MTEQAPPIVTERLRLVAWTVEIVDALIAADRDALLRLTGARFPVPFAPPPETGDVLEFFRALLAADPEWTRFPPRLIVRLSDSAAIGSAGVTPPDPTGRGMLGYGIYPVYEGLGYATEAAIALVNWALQQSNVRSIGATIRPDNVASQRVASKAGLRPKGEQRPSDEGPLDLWLIERTSH